MTASEVTPTQDTTAIPSQRRSGSSALSREFTLPSLTLTPRMGRILLLVLCLLTAGVYSLLGINRYVHFVDGGFDLGIFSQAIQSLAHGHAAAAPIDLKAHQNFFGDHFEPVLYIPALLWRLFPSPVTLIVFQALLVAASVPFVYRFTHRRWSVGVSLVFSLLYVSYWGVQSMALFDFHEVAFVVPLTAIMLERADAGHFRTAALVAFSLLLVKEDMALTLAAFGLLLALYYRQRLLGSALVLSGVGGFLLLIKIVIPAMLPSGKFVYFQKLYGQLGSTPGEILKAPFVHPLHTLKTLFTPSTKLHTLRDTFLPWFFLPLFSPLLLVGLPLLLERFLASLPGYWMENYHYTGPLAPILALGFVDTFERIRRHVSPRLARQWGERAQERIKTLPALGLGVLLVSFLFAVPSWSPVRFAFDPTPAVLSYLPGDDGCARLIDRVPAGADVEASTGLTPHLVTRTTVWLPGEDPHAPQYLLERKSLNRILVPNQPFPSPNDPAPAFPDLRTAPTSSSSAPAAALQSLKEVGLPEETWIHGANLQGYTITAVDGNCRLWKAPTS